MELLTHKPISLCWIIKNKIKIVGVDIDINKVNNLKNGKSYISDIKTTN